MIYTVEEIRSVVETIAKKYGLKSSISIWLICPRHRE